MRRIFLYIICLLSSQISYAQYIKSLGFDITYATQQQALTDDHKELLVMYLDYLKSDQIIIFNIDTTYAHSSSIEHKRRIQLLKEFLIKQGVAPELILLIKKDTSYLKKNDNEDFETISCKILYSTADRDKKITKDSSSNVIYNDPTIAGVGKFGSTTCAEDTTISMGGGVKLALNKCDLERFQEKINFKPSTDSKSIYSSHEFIHLKTNFLRSYDFYINGSQVFMFGNVLKIPLESCIGKEDLSVYLYKDKHFKLLPIENINSPEDLFILIKTSELGQIVLTYTNHLKQYKVEFEVDKTLHLELLDFDTQCNGMTFHANLKKNKASVTLTESHFEPLVSMKAKDEKGRIYCINNKPLSSFGGEEKLKDFRVYTHDSKSKEEKTFPVYKKYFIPTNDLKLE